MNDVERLDEWYTNIRATIVAGKGSLKFDMKQTWKFPDSDPFNGRPIHNKMYLVTHRKIEFDEISAIDE